MNTKKHFSIREVAALTGIPEHRIAYAHRCGKLPEPNHVAGKRIYSRIDIARIQKHFDIKGETWTAT